jgi:uncharacterized metal-binding protein
MAADCCKNNGNIMLLACSGGSNVGQLSNQAAVELTQEGWGKMFCLAGIAGHLSGFVQSAKDVENMVIIEGCQVGCSKAIMEHLGIPLKNYIVLTDLGIEKNKDFKLRREEIDKVKASIKDAVGKEMKVPTAKNGGAAPCR